MIGYIVTSEPGASDLLIAGLAAQLQALGLRVGGAVQVNSGTLRDSAVGPSGRLRCDMHLHLLGSARRIAISQNLGAYARGCRLDSAGLEDAAGAVEAELSSGSPPQVLIVNKFGKQECEGRGFCGAIALALEAGIPVVLAVNPTNLTTFTDWADGFAEALPPRPEALVHWCRAQLATG